jgi:hypothetical protein
MSIGMPFVLHMFSQCPEQFTGDYVRTVTDSRQLGFELRGVEKNRKKETNESAGTRGLSREYAVHEQLIKRSLQSFRLPAEKRA